jgi:hypothetical protein
MTTTFHDLLAEIARLKTLIQELNALYERNSDKKTRRDISIRIANCNSWLDELRKEYGECQ